MNPPEKPPSPASPAAADAAPPEPDTEAPAEPTGAAVDASADTVAETPAAGAEGEETAAVPAAAADTADTADTADVADSAAAAAGPPPADPPAVGPVAGMDGGADTGADGAATAPPRPRRWGRRTAALAVAGVLLGALGGTTVGYAVQYQRPPTATPPLNQPGFPALPVPTATSAPAGDRSDGDLRRKLLPKPKGADKASAAWSLAFSSRSLEHYALNFTEPGTVLGNLLDEDARRVVSENWQEHGKVVNVTLVRFGEKKELASDDLLQIHKEDMATNESSGTSIPGTGDGRVFAMKRGSREDGWSARAVARRGKVLIDIIYVDLKKPVDLKWASDIAARQWSRL